jgi:hypothetical protein
MKKLLCLLLLAAMASAQAFPKCVRYTNRELSAMRVDELKTILKENVEIANENSRMFASAEERAAAKHCQIQNQRINDVLKQKMPQTSGQ